MKATSFSLSLLSSALLFAGLYPINWFWYAWLAWIPLFLLTEILSENPKRLVFLIFLIFAVYYGIGNYWLLYYQLPLFLAITFVAAAVITLYFGLYHLFTRKSRSVTFKILCAFLLWLLLQSLVRLTPITTALFEAPFYGPLEFFQAAAIADYSFWGALILSISLAITFVIYERSRTAMLWVVVFLTCVSSLYVWGHHRLSFPEQGKLKVALIQHNIPISGEWNFKYPDEIRKRYKDSARKAAALKPDLIVFPLYNLPDDPLRKPDFFSKIAKENNTYLLVASHVPELPGKSVLKYGYQNVAVLYASDGKLLSHYQSVLKPPAFSPIREYNASEYKALNSPFGKLGILLCYEDSKPQIAKMAKMQGARFLIALSNPGFFNRTSMPYYHLIQDRLRAVETGLPLLRISANGYTAQIDSRGRFLQKTRLDEEEILLVEV